MTRKHYKSPRTHGGESSKRNLPVVEETDLSLESTSSQTLRGLYVSNGSSAGWNPYDTVPNNASTTSIHRLDDMRRLSEWIRLKRELEHNPDKEQIGRTGSVAPAAAIYRRPAALPRSPARRMRAISAS